MSKTSRTYGLWDSPISPALVAEGRRLEGGMWDTDGRTLVWLEGRSGQGVLVVSSGEDAPRDLTADRSVRAEVGYGGGDFTVSHGHAYYVVHKTGRIFRQSLTAGGAKPITPAFGQAASPAVSPDGKFLVYVHHAEEIDRLAIVDTEGQAWPAIFASGHDFYMQPCWSPDGRYVAWIAWDHPRMPWDGTFLYVARVEISNGLPTAASPVLIAGGPDTAVFQPEFSCDSQQLFYVSDETGWGRIAAHDLHGGPRPGAPLRWLTPAGVEHAAPAWAQGRRMYAVSSDGKHLFAARHDRGVQQLVRISIATGENWLVEPLADYTDVNQVVASPTSDAVLCVASSPIIPTRIIRHDFNAGETQVVARSAGETIAADDLAACEPISWTSAQGETCYGLYYAPASRQFESAGLPPLVALIHGGPTSQVNAGWRTEAQFFATRGYGVLYVNYRGSTGYGRDYMLRLRGNWGVCDVEDALSGARRLGATNRINPAKTVIMGGSAGGYTVLQTMVDHPTAFAAGVNLYGVANQFHLAQCTHKFEARYLDSLLGPLPEAAAIYRARSPEYAANRIQRPLAIFQGEIDQVVPKAQSDAIAAALKRSGVPHVYHVYAGEGHGWRKRETIEHYYRALEDFLREHVIYGA